MRMVLTDRDSTRTKGRKPNLLAILFVAYYLVAASAIFLTARHIQGAELLAFSNLVLKSAIGLDTPAIRLLLPPPDACNTVTGVCLLAIVLLPPLMAGGICLRCLRRGEARNMASYDRLERNLRFF